MLSARAGKPAVASIIGWRRTAPMTAGAVRPSSLC